MSCASLSAQRCGTPPTHIQPINNIDNIHKSAWWRLLPCGWWKPPSRAFHSWNFRTIKKCKPRRFINGAPISCSFHVSIFEINKYPININHRLVRWHSDRPAASNWLFICFRSSFVWDITVGRGAPVGVRTGTLGGPRGIATAAHLEQSAGHRFRIVAGRCPAAG